MDSSFFYKIFIISSLSVFFQVSLFGITNLPFIIPNINSAPLIKNFTQYPNSSSLCFFEPSDTLPKPSKYQGYRLYLTQINVEKETDTWIRINCTVINTGDKPVDFGQKGREHWVQVLFDDSIRSSKLGGFKDNIRQGLYNENFKLAPGKIAANQELKFMKILEWSQPKKEESASEVIILTPKIKEETIDAEYMESLENCADLVVANCKIVEEHKKYVVVEYSIKNVGKGPALLKKKEKSNDLLVGLRFFLSGATVVSRASKELGTDVLRVPYYKKYLYPDEEITQRTEIKTRDKTAFLKYLVLQIDSYHLLRECDRRNNEQAVELK